MTCPKSHNKGRDSTVTPLPEIWKRVAQIQWTRGPSSWATGHEDRRYNGATRCWGKGWSHPSGLGRHIGGRIFLWEGEERDTPLETQQGRGRQVRRPLASTSPDSWLITSEDLSGSLYTHLLNGVRIFTNFLGAGFEVSLTWFSANSSALNDS